MAEKWHAERTQSFGNLYTSQALTSLKGKHAHKAAKLGQDAKSCLTRQLARVPVAALHRTSVSAGKVAALEVLGALRAAAESGASTPEEGFWQQRGCSTTLPP